MKAKLSKELCKSQEWRIDPQDLHVDFNRLMARLDKGVHSGLIQRLAKVIIQKAKGVMDVRAGGVLFSPQDVAFVADSIEIQGKPLHVKKIIFSRLQKSETVALYTATIGAGMEELARSLIARSDFLEGYLVDFIASEFAELASIALEQKIREKIAPMNWGLTNRYSPGYCGWDVADQKILFSFFPPGFSGVELNFAAMMSPVKSVSGIIGLGKDSKPEEYECVLCDIEDCIHRVS
jgi:hypothetical protein